MVKEFKVDMDKMRPEELEKLGKMFTNCPSGKPGTSDEVANFDNYCLMKMDLS